MKSPSQTNWGCSHLAAWAAKAWVLGLALMLTARGGAIFQDDFEGAVRPEWSSSARDNSYPGTFTWFLGRMGNSRPELTLTGLEPGVAYKVTFDLYVIDSWDGDDYGPDTFRVLVDGVAALDRTISQFGGTQTWSIAAEVKGQLGFSGWEDSIFRQVPVTFTASATTAVLGFEGANLQDINDESWGIDNVAVWKVADLAAEGFVAGTLPSEGTARAMAVDLFELDARVVLDEATATDPGKHEMRGAGPNRVFGDADDVVAPLEVSRIEDGMRLRLRMASGALPPGLWRYQSGAGIHDVDGNAVGVLTRGFEVLGPAPVFEDNFEGRNRPEWSSTTRDGTYPAVFSRFLGRAGNGRVELALSRLTAGVSYTVLFDLYILDSWEGSDYGPDTFRVLVDGVVALDRTISQFGGTQTWGMPPDVKGPLGFSGWDDSIFRRVPVTFTASAETVVLAFEGANLESLDNESWGIDNVAGWKTSDLAARGFVGTTLPGEGATVALALDRFETWALMELDPTTATSATVHEMRGAGPNRTFGDGDDVVVALQVTGTGAPGRLRVLIPGGPLQAGLWRYRTFPGLTTSGGLEVASFIRTFEVVNPVLGSIEGLENDVLVGAGVLPVNESPAGLGAFVGYGLGTFFGAGDVDYWRFEAEAGERVTVTLEATDRPGIYPWLQLRTAADGVLAQSQGGYWEGRSRVEGVALAAPGTYYLRVWSDHGTSGYRLRVERARAWQGEASPTTPVAFRIGGGDVTGRVAGHLEGSGGDDVLDLGVLGSGTTVRAEAAFPDESDLSAASLTLTLEDGSGNAVDSATGGLLNRLVASAGAHRLRVSSATKGFRAGYVVTVRLVDATAPAVVSAALPAEGSTSTELITQWNLEWVEELDPTSAGNDSQYGLRRSANDVFGDADDVVIPVTATYAGGVFVGIGVPGPLQPGRYRFTVGTGVTDLSGNGLPTPYVREFALANAEGFVMESLSNDGIAGATPLGPLGSGDGSFILTANLPGGSYPYGIAQGDLDGDSHLDLVMANSSGDVDLTVYPGNGDGTFGLPRSLAAGGVGLAVAVGDIDGDGDLDVVASNHGTHRVSLLENLGGLSFAAPVSHAVGNHPRDVRLGDLDGDGVPEIVVPVQGQDFLVVLKRESGGGYTRNDYPNGGNAWAVALGDLNGDGHADVVTASHDRSGLQVLMNNGDGTLGAPSSVALPGSHIDVAVADMDGDGRMDAVALEHGGSVVRVLRGDGAGGFEAPTSFTGLGGGAYHLAVADYDGDGDRDVAVAAYGSAQLGVFLNGGGGNLGTPMIYGAGGYPIAVSPGDWNEDGVKDLATANYQGQSAGVWLGHRAVAMNEGPPGLSTVLGRGSLSPNYSDVDYYRFTARAGDLLVVGVETLGSPAASQLYYRVDDAAGNYVTDFYASSYNGWGQRGPVTLGRDGSYFLRVSHNYGYTGEYRVRVNLLRDGLQSEGDTVANDSPGSPSGLSLALDGGKLVARVAGAISTGDGPDHFRLGDLSEGTTVNLLLEPFLKSTLAGRLALVRPDGSEVAVGEAGATTLVHVVGAGGGTLLAQVTADVGAGIQGQYVLAVTLADDRPPTVVALDLPAEGSSTTGLIQSFQATFSEDMAASTVNGAANVEVRSSENEMFGDSDDSVYSVAGVGYSGGRMATFQIADGPLQPGRYQVTLRTGLTDRSGNPMAGNYVRRFVVVSLPGFVSENRSNDVAYGSTPMGPPGGADGSWSSASTLVAGANPYDVARGDLDGDGRADLVVANISSGNLSVWYGNGDGTFTAAAPLTSQSGPISVVVGDVDSDGRADVVAVNHSSHTATIHAGDSGRTFAPVQFVAVGVNPRNVRLGDLNGDGLPEILVANQSSDFVTILKPDGSGGFAREDLSVGFGIWSVAAGDLDGDGRADLVAVGSSGLAVFKGDAGGLALESVRPVTGEPADVALVDLDGDGDLDAAVLNRTGRSIAIFRNNAGALPAAPEYVGGLGSEPFHMTATDLDGDGDPDLAVAVYGSSQWARLMNDGSGGLGAPVAIGTGGNPIGIVAGDWNGDGVRDVATANHSGNSLSIWLGNRASLLAEGPPGLLTGLARGRLADTSDYDFYRFSARAGEVLTVGVETEGNPPASQLYYRVDGPNGEYITDFYANSYYGWGQSAPVTLTQGGSYTVYARHNYDYRGEYRLRVSLARGGMQSEREDNNSAGAATEIVLSPAGGRATGRIAGYFRQDEGAVGDFYRVASVGGGQALDVSWAAVTVGKVGANLVVRGPSGEVVGSGDAATGLRVVPAAGLGGTHTIQVLPTVPRRTTAAARSNLQFLGNTQVRVPLNVPEDAMTVSFWFLSLSPDSGLFEVAGGGHDRHLYLSSGNIYARLYNHEVIGSSGLNLGDGRWHHVAYQYGAAIGGQRIYVDGSLAASGSKASSDFTWQTDVGFGYSSDRGYLVGAIEDVSIWSSALPEDLVMALRTTALNGSEPGLIGSWPLNEGTGTTVTALGGEVSGTISGPAAWGAGVAGAQWVGIETAYVLTASVEDGVAPVVADLDVAAEGGTTQALVNGLTLTFSEDMDAATINAAGHYELRWSGNGVFGDGDDEVYALTTEGYVSGLTARLKVESGPLQPGTYRFTARTGLRDRAGNPLASPFVRSFTVGKLGLFVAENLSNDSAIRGTAVGAPGGVTRDLFRAGDLSSPGPQYELASGDLDGDGIDDLVVANNGQTFVRVFLGRGDGTFREPLDVVTARSATGVQVGDVDGDGRNDLVLANNDHHGVTVVRNLGSMTFVLPVFVPTGQNPLVTRLADLDADGIPEIIVANSSSYFLTVLRRQADGTYGRKDVASDGRPATLAVSNVDGGGRVDVVAGNWSDGSVSVYRNDGAGGLKEPVSHPVASVPRGIGLGDLTGDGLLDIVVVQAGNQNVGVLVGRGDGNFDSPVQYPGAGSEPWFLALDDLDSDGRLDVVVGGYGSNRLVRYFNEVGGVLGEAVALNGNNNPIGVVTGDWNRDGVRDVASANHNGGITLWMGTRRLELAEDPTGLTSILVRGAMEKDQDEDWFQFSARAGDVLQVNTETGGSPGGSHLYVEVFGPSGVAVVGAYSGWTGSLTTDPVVLTEEGVHALRVRIPWWWGQNYRGEYRAWVGLGRGGLAFERDGNQADGVGNASPVSFVLSGGVQRARVAGHVASVDSGDVFHMGNLGDGTTVRAALVSPAAGTLVAGLELLDATGTVLASAVPGTSLEQLVAASGLYFVRVRPDGGHGLAGRYVLNLSWSDSTPPVIASTSLSAEGTSTEALLDAFEVRFSEDMDAATVNDAGNVEVRVSANGVFGDGDDVVYPVASPGYSGGLVASWSVPGGPLKAGNVLVTLGTGFKDRSGNPLAAPFVRQFEVRSRPGFVREGGNNDQPSNATRLGSAPSTTPDGSFLHVPTAIPTGGNPYDIAGIDLDGDGLKDLVVANWGGHSVQVFRSNGDGTFQSPTTYPTGAYPYTLVVEDLTGDGKPDIATANYYGDSVTLWTGVGDGTFAGSLTWPVSNNPLGIAVGDVDGDGDMDAVVTRHNANAVAVLLRDGTTGIAAGADVPTEPGPAIVRLARVNADAHLDMVVAHYGSASVGVYLGDGSGGFAPPVLMATPHRPHTLEVVDLDGDGALDIAVANEGASSLSEFKGRGDGTFGTRTDLPAGNNPYVQVADLNGDGRPELIAGNYGSGTIGLWRNRGDGTFEAMTTLVAGLSGPTRLAAADWNGDGILDLASANYGGNNVSILLGNGVQALSLDAGGNGIRSVAAYGRLNGGGDADWWSFGARAGEKLVLSTENPGRPPASQLYFRVIAANSDTVVGFYPDYYGTGQSGVFTVPSDGTYLVVVSPNYGYYSEYQFRLALSPPGATPEAETNDGIANATPLLLAPSGEGRAGTGVGHIHSAGDLDYFDLGTVESGQTVFLNVRLQSGATFQPVVGVYDASNGYRIEASGGRGFDGVAEVDVVSTGRYYAVVRASGAQGGLLQAYVLETLVVPTSTVGLPNLQATTVATPSGPLRSGDNVTVEFQVANVGRQPTGASAWTDRVVLSSNPTLGDLDDVQLGVVSRSGALASGESYSVSRSLRIPDGVSGDFFVFVQADAANAVTEFVLENDNVTASAATFRVDLADYPDLVIESLAVSKGDAITASWNIANRGRGAAAAGWRESVALRHLASGVVVWREERVVAAGKAPGTTAPRSAAPPWPVPGRYRLEVAVDVGDDVFEFNDASHASAEGNNVASAALDVERDLAVANLRIEPAGTLRSGDSIVVRWDTAAAGDVPPGDPWVDRVRVVNRTTGAVLLDVHTTGREAALTLPVLGAGVGQIEATVTVDAANAIPEFALTFDAEANNSAFVLRTSEPAPYPDLAVSVGDVPAAADAGQSVTLSWTLSNAGIAPVGVPWRDDVYLSPGTGLDGARYVGSYLNDGSSPSGGALAAGASILNSASFTIPADLFGSLRVVVVTDGASVLTEPSKLNNRAASAAAVLIRKPNLVPSAVVAPAVADAGETVEVRWTVTNGGNGGTFSGWRASVALSASADGSGAVVLGSIQRAESLASGEVVEQVASVSLPAGFAGNRHVVVTLDTTGEVPESNESDNVAVSSAAMGLRAPNLLALDVTGPASAVPGVAFEVRWTARNVGSAVATAPWSDGLYLSSDAAWGGDVSLAGVASTGSLAAGASREVTASVVVPVDGPAGDLYILVATDTGNAVAESNESDNVGVSAAVVTVPLTLTVTGGAPSVAESGSALTYTVTRNGDRSAALAVTLASTTSTALAVPAGVTIPAGQSSTTFAATPVADGVVAGDRPATLTVSATGFADVMRSVTVTDVDVPRLSLALDASEMGEGASVPARVTRDPVTASALTVNVVSTAPGQFVLPATVTIPAGEASVAFAVVTVDDLLVEADTPTTLTVTATGHEGASRPLTVLDDDTFTLGLSLAATTFPENAGAAATVGTVTRAPVTSQAISVALASSDPTAATVPTSVTIPAGQASATFNVSAVNDGVVDGSQMTEISASASLSGRPAVVATPVTATVTDDDGPMLTLTLEASAAREGASPATLGTVRRNTATASALLVSLASDNPGEATVPATVEIPAGAAEATFPVATVADGVTDGAKVARITASAAGHESSTASLTVTDADLPDLVVAWVESPGVVETESLTSARLRVENRGNVAATGPFVVRLYTSADAVAGGDTYAAQYTFAGSLPAGAYFELAQGFTAPRRVGPLYLVAEVDPVRVVPELAEDNNAAVSASVMDVRAAYTAVASTDVSMAMAGTPVPIRGTVTRGDGAPGVGASVTVHVVVRGTRRTLGAIADGLGAFAVTFNPLPGEAGNYEIAAAHPGVSDPTVQDRFTLVGIRVDTAGAMRVIEGQSAASGTRIQNLSDVPVTGLTVEATEVPLGLTVTPSLGSATLAGNGSVDVAYGVAVADGTTTGGLVRFRVTGSGGITGTFEVPVIVEALRPNLVAVPGSLERGMRRGVQTTVQFDLVNRGGRPTGPLKLLIPPLSWMRVAAGGEVNDLWPGETNPVTVVLTPPADLPLGPYTGSFYAQAEAAGLNVPFTFRAVSEAVGTLRVEAVDEFTYYAEGEPRVAGATVVVSDAVTGTEVARRTTGANGIAEFVDLREDFYRVEVTADGHGSYRGTHLLEAAKTTAVTAFLPRQTVRYRWTVEPIQVEDRTKITIETVFETAVPVPVVTMEPAVVDLADVTGDEIQVDLTITNHGLIAAQSSRFVMPTHPGWEFIPLITDVGDIPANSSLTIPMTVRRLGGAGGGALVGVRRAARTAGSGGPCVVGGGLIWELPCGPRINAYTVPITFSNAGTDCGGTDGGWSGGGSGGGSSGGGGGGGGPTSVFNPPDISMPELCDCRYIPRLCGGGSFEFDLSGRLEALVSAVLSKLPGARLTDSDMKVSFSGEICTCCVNNKISWEGKATGSGTIKAQVELGPGVAAELSFKDSPPWKKVKVDGSALAGVRLTLTGSVQGTYEKKCDEEPIFCIEGNAHLQAFAGAEFEGHASAFRDLTVDGVEFGEVGFSGDVGGQIGLEGNLGASFKWCRGSGGSITACGNLVARANIGGSLEATLPDGTKINRSINLSGDSIIAGGECDAAGGRLGVAPAAGGRRARVAGAFDGPFTETLPGDLFPLPTAEIAKALNLDRPPDAVCARVKLKLEQEAVLTRDAFRAILEIDNADVSQLSEIEVSLRFRDADSVDAAERFGVRPPEVSGMGAVNGTGSLAANTTGKAIWVLVPTRDAAGAAPRVYSVGGSLRYRQNGVLVTVPLADVPITVYPQPLLTLQYFHQRDVYSDDPFTPVVEPSIPYALGVMVRNGGFGQARNFRITSAQPKIVENERGLLIDFQLIGTQVAGEEVSPSLTANFGAINAGDIKVGRWLFTSSLQGLFIDYSAKFEHIDSLGNPRLSLIDDVTIHEMIHQVEAQGALADGKPDFLVNDMPDVRDLPDTLYLSQGGTNRVEVVELASVDSTPSGSDTVVELTATMPAGWAYLRVPEPSDGSMQLTRVVRSDGRELPVDRTWWVTDRTFGGMGRRPTRENILHLLDDDSTGRYTLHYNTPAGEDHVAPSSAVGVLPARSPRDIALAWSGTDDASGVAGFDVYVSRDGGPYALWLEGTTLRGALYGGDFGATYRFYSVASDRAGNRESAPAAADATTTVAFESRGPVLGVVNDVGMEPSTTYTGLPYSVEDPDTPLDLLGVSFVSSNPALLPAEGVVSVGTGQTRTLSLTPVPGQYGTADVTMRVTDGTETAVRLFKVTVYRPNRAPLAGNDVVSITRATSMRIPVATLLVNDSDPDGDAVFVDSVSPLSTAGGQVQLRGLFVVYTPPAGAPATDTFVYTIGDGFRGLTTASVQVTLTDPEPTGSALSLVSMRATPQSVVLEFVGVRGRRYRIERSPNMQPPWTALGTATADAFGRFRFEDTTPLDSMGFYQIVWVTGP